MKEIVVTDDYGRETKFAGENLVGESTDTAAGSKPQWLNISVWRTKAGSFVVERATNYRIRHTSDRCPRAEGYALIPATILDTYTCQTCNKYDSADALAQARRISVDVYHTPEELITSFQTGGRYNNLARSVLAEISDQDERIGAAWNTVTVP